MRPTASLLLQSLLLLMIAVYARPAHASNGLNRCIGSDGTSIFTDQKCEDIGALQRADPAPVAGNGNGFSRLRASACARKPEDLLYGIENAINAGDVNQVAAFYHWPGVSSAASLQIFQRLQRLVEHPVLSIDLLYAQTRHEEYDSELATDNLPRRAYAVQIVQSRSERDTTPIRSALALRRNIGCWWVQF